MRLRLIILSVLCGLTSLHAFERREVNLDYVTGLARELAAQPYVPAKPELPPELAALDFDGYRKIRFNKDKALWKTANLPFQVDFFHNGYIFPETVEIFEYSNTHTQQIPYVKDFFNFDINGINPDEWDLQGYAGLRVRTPLNKPDVFDDVLVFQGASYFRALGRDQYYGLSARGLAIGTGGPNEEFPRFSRFWLKKPASDARSLEILALLEGQSVTGAYRFVLTPGENTQVEVTARVFRREGARGDIYFAPLTSMFWYGEARDNHMGDWRPEIHDSDGLLIHNGDTWTWRPLTNYPGNHLTAFPVEQLHGFGLLQRDRDFNNYQDLSEHYHRRPSAWIQTRGQWPTGEVVLFEFHQDTETVDNMGAFFRPDTAPEAGQPYEIAYTVNFQLADPDKSLNRVEATRIGSSWQYEGATRFIIDFSAPENFKPVEIRDLQANLSVEGAEIIQQAHIIYNTVTSGLRVHFDLRADPDTELANLKLQLTKADKPLSETWVYQWRP
ncbi:glucan biosynthesis protein G [Ruficoccus amylovorans]|uniref:Glucan biosynthesis protein G n=1 Tax=Ruficoccus amylovorans TaxID=1804625 RepID=A0A842HCP0_9BACT|nr:glucan biosynthesis protein G [Ruficoccus amylovorans]MBC2594192.1 glucan biosynthesis protein G [Ruficoccus amylovorans]